MHAALDRGPLNNLIKPLYLVGGENIIMAQNAYGSTPLGLVAGMMNRTMIS